MLDRSLLKVVILGQDPYPSLTNACGLAFSLRNPSLNIIATPASLKPIYASLHKFNLIDVDDHGCLYNWLNQGVLLFNITPLIIIDTTYKGELKSIWEVFINTFISELSKENSDLIWVLWGKDAKGKITAINNFFDKESKHLIHQYHHPSPQANNSLPEELKFANRDHFGDINRTLTSLLKQPIDWNVTQTTMIFTDGCCLDNNTKNVEVRPSGHAIVFAAGPYKGRIYYQRSTGIGGKISTNNRAELYAVIEAMKICIRHQFIGPLIIHVDNKYTYDMITSYIHTWDDETIMKKDNIDLVKYAKIINTLLEQYYCHYGGVQMRLIERNSSKCATLADTYSKKAAVLTVDDVIIATFD